MNILIFTDTFLPAISGISTSIYMLVQELAAQNHAVLLICPKFKEKESVHLSGVKIVRLPSIPAPDFVYPGLYLGTLNAQTMKLVRDFHPDIVHLMTPASIGIEGLGLAKAMKWPVVATFHGYFMAPEYLQIAKINFGANYVSRFLWSYARVFYNACDGVVSPSMFVRNDLRRHKFSKPIYVCSNGLEIDTSMRRHKELSQFLQRYAIEPKSTILYVGRTSVEKSIDELIQSFELVLKSVPEAKLLIVGDGPALKDLMTFVVSRKLSGKVIFTGEMPHKDVLEVGIFKSAAVFASCSTSEVQPMSMIEATAFGLPLVVYKARGAGDMVERNGYAIKTGDKPAFAKALVRILSNPALHKRLSHEALNVAQRYSVDFCTREMVTVYEKTIEKQHS